MAESDFVPGAESDFIIAVNVPDCKVLAMWHVAIIKFAKICLPIYTIYNLVAHTGLEPLVLYRGLLYSVVGRITIHTTAHSIGCEVAQ